RDSSSPVRSRPGGPGGRGGRDLAGAVEGAGEDGPDIVPGRRPRRVGQYLIVEGVRGDAAEIGGGDPKVRQPVGHPDRVTRRGCPAGATAPPAASAFHPALRAVSPAPRANATAARRSPLAGRLNRSTPGRTIVSATPWAMSNRPPSAWPMAWQMPSPVPAMA